MTIARPQTIEARIKRSLSVWEDAGREVGAVEITADGTIRILAPEAVSNLRSTPKVNSCDEEFGTGSG